MRRIEKPVNGNVLHERELMERNKPATIFAVVIIGLICIAGVAASFAASPETPIKTSLLTLGVILGGLVAITGIHFFMFVPLFTLMTKLLGKKSKQENAEPAPGHVRK